MGWGASVLCMWKGLFDFFASKVLVPHVDKVRRKLSKVVGWVAYLVLLRLVFLFFLIVTYWYLCKICTISIIYITESTMMKTG